MTTYLASFSLNNAPFTKEIPDTDLWMPTSKKKLVDDLVEAIEARASVMLAGEPGVGKTTVLRALRHRLGDGRFRLTYCHNATLGRRDFYRQLCQALGLAPSATAASLFFAVSSHVQDLSREQKHPVFLLDEAHLLHQDTLDHLHILLNYEWDSRALLSLVLVGLPELHDRLELRRNRSLYSRIQHRFAIGTLTPDDSADYIGHRLAQAGCQREVFTSDAVAIIHEAALASLREIDRIAGLALSFAAKRKRKLVERDVVEAILAAEARPN